MQALGPGFNINNIPKDVLICKKLLLLRKIDPESEDIYVTEICFEVRMWGFLRRKLLKVISWCGLSASTS